MHPFEFYLRTQFLSMVNPISRTSVGYMNDGFDGIVMIAEYCRLARSQVKFPQRLVQPTPKMPARPLENQKSGVKKNV